MDGSNNTGVNTSHLARPDSVHNGFNMDNTFLGGLQDYADSNDVTSGNDDLSNFLHPDLFEQNGSGSSATQQGSSSFQSPFNQHASRQSHSPALPQYNPPQQSYSTQSSYPQQPTFDGRNPYQQQQSFDPRMFQQQRSTQSPAPLDQFSYQNPSFNQNYLQQQSQPRPSSTTPQPYVPPPRQQAFSPFSGWDSRNPASFNPYQSFQEQSPQTTHNFVDPSIFNGSQLQNMNGTFPSLAPRQQYQPSPYFSKSGSGITIDPRTLQGQQQQILHNQQRLQQQQQQQQQQPSQTGVLLTPQIDGIPKKKAPKDPNAPKRPRGRPRKDGQPPRQAGDQASETDSELSVENEPEMRPAIISVSMPTDLRGQTLYKAVQAVWCDRNNPAPLETIQSGIADFGNAVKAFRDAWKVKNDNLKKAEIENSPIASRAPALKKEVSDERAFMGVIMDCSLSFGHPHILSSLGQNQWVMSALYSFMLDRVTAGDLDSSLVASILKLGVNFDTLDDSKLEEMKWSKLLQRLTKKATNESKALAQQIIAKASAVTAKKNAEGDRPSPKANGEASPVGVKRSRESDGGQPLPRKTLLKPASKPLALQNAERRRVQEREEAARIAKSAKEATGNANGLLASTTSKLKVPVPTQAPSFATLMSASKKPGTTNAERAAAAKDKTPAFPPIKKDGLKRDSPPRSAAPAARSQPSFMGILSDFNKKKEVKSEREVEPLNETPEQKTKRLRKEARRKLRVSWKSDTELVETRLFTHDPEEEIGHQDSMMKDAGDTMSEGEMLKRKMAMTDLEDEEEDEEMPEDTYSPPSEIDFSAILERDPSADIEENGVKCGGPVKPASPSGEAQDKLEANTLMVVYDGKSDRPISPKEPPEDGDDDNFEPSVDFGEPDEKIRAKEKEALRRRQPATGALNGLDLSSLAQRMAQPQTAAPPQAGVPPNLQSILSQFGGQQQPSAVPQPSTSTPSLDLKALVASVHKAQQAPPQFQPPAQPAPSGAFDVSAFLAAYQQGTGANQNAPLGKHALEDAEDSEKKKSKYPPNYKTQVCSFWKEGRCTKGDNCTYKHAE